MTHWIPGGAIAAVLLAACAAPELPPPDTEAVGRELTARLAELRTAMLAGDAEPFSAFWTEDARVLEPGVDKAGEALRQHIRDIFAAATVTSFDIRRFDLFVHGDVAYETGEYDETAQFEGQEPMTFHNYYFLRWERGANGVWRMDRLVAGPRTAPASM